jgi:hypothetical protein
MLWVHVGVDGSIDCQVNVGNKVRQGNGFELFIVTETNNVENFEINRVGYIKPGEQEIVSLNVPVRREENIEFELNRPSQANSFFKGGATYNGYMASIPSDATTFYGNGGHIQLVIYAVSVDGRSENTQNVTVFVEPTYGSKYVGISDNDYGVILRLFDDFNKNKLDRENPIIYDSKGNVSARFTHSGLSITGSSLTLNDETWGFTKVSKKGTDGTKRSVGMLLFNFLYDSGTSVDLGSALLLTDTRQVFALSDESIEFIELTKQEIVVSEETANYLTMNRVDLSSIPDWVGERYVKKLGAGSGYRVYMVAPDGSDTFRTASSSLVNGAIPLRTSTGQLELPDQAQNVPGGNQAISKGYADGKYLLDRKTTDFHPITTFRWLNDNNQREMTINGSWIIFYAGGNQLLTIRGDYFTYLDKAVKWSDLADIVENKSPLLNGDRGAIGSYKSDGNGISSATTFAGSDITNTAKGINSFSLGRLNVVEGAGCLAYGNKNTVKGAGSVALGGGNTSGDRIDWTSASASVNNSSAYCISLGENNTTTGRSAVSVGISNKSNGDGSVSVGRDNTVWSKESVAIGRNNTLNKVSTGSYDEQEPDQGNGVVAIGTGLMTPKRWNDVNLESLYWNCVVVGRYNDPYVYGCARSTDLPYKNNCAPVFTLGNGSDDSNRRNSIVTFHNSGFQERRYDWTYFNDYCLFNQICEFRNANNIFENNITVWGIVKDKQGVQYLKGGQISDTFINSLF